MAGPRTLLTSTISAAFVLAAPGTASFAASADQGSSSPAASADALKAAASDEAVKTFYENAGWHAMWSDSNAAALDQALANRKRHGLDRVVFLPDAGSVSFLAMLNFERGQLAKLGVATSPVAGMADFRQISRSGNRKSFLSPESANFAQKASSSIASS